MSEQPATQNSQNKTPTAPLAQLAIDLGPTALFVLAYNLLQRMPAYKDNAVYIATGLFVATTLLAIAYGRWKTGRIPPVLIVTGIIVTAFGGLTIALHNPTFIVIRPSIANTFYAVAIAGSVAAKQNVWKLMFGHVFTLPDRIWNVLALRWAAFFLLLAGVNEVLRHTLSMSGWVTWHFPILYGATLAYALANTPLVLKHAPPEDSDAGTAT